MPLPRRRIRRSRDLRAARPAARRSAASGAAMPVLPRDPAKRLRRRRGAARRRRAAREAGRALAPRHHREAVRPRSGLGAGAQPRDPRGAWTSSRSIASTIISARRRCRTSWCSASPTACSSRCGTATISTMCRSPSPRRWASSGAADSTTRTGALRDMVPNHLFQLLTLTAMEPPTCFDADAVRGEKAKVLQTRPSASAPRMRCATSCAAQYGAGAVGGQADRGLSRRARRRAGLDDRDLCRAEADDRQLALGRRAVLSAHRQGAGARGAARS